MNWVETDFTEPIFVYVTDSSGDPLTGLSDVFVRLMRVADGLFYDWDDAIFKSSAWTTLEKVTVAVDATRSPGMYQVTGGLPTTDFASGSYLVIPLQTPGTNARLPAPGELHVGDMIDHVLLSKKLLLNEMTLADGATGNMVVLDDDDVTPLKTFNASDKDGKALLLPAGAPARRSRGA